MSIYEAYADYLRGRSVAIIGGADNYDPGFIVGNFEIVVGINDHVHRQDSVADIIYHTIRGPDLCNGLVRLLDYTPKFFWANMLDYTFENGFSDKKQRDEYVELWHKPPNSYVGGFTPGTWEGENPYGPEFEWLNDLHKKYDCKLLTGLVALADILRYQPNDIFVCGMDLYINEKPKGRKGWRDSHRLSGNIEFLKDSLKDCRVTFDSPLLKALARCDL